MKFGCKCFSKDFCVIYSLVYFCWFVNLLLIQKEKKLKRKKKNTKKNPADLLTRSENFENFHENKFWFQGPEFSKHKSTFENRDFQNSFDVEHVFFK